MLNDCFALGGPITEIAGLSTDDALFSCGGDSMKHSPRDMDVDVDNLLLPAPKRKGGSWASGLGRCGMEPDEYVLALPIAGRSKIVFFLLHDS
jgi:hypothetical protein